MPQSHKTYITFPFRNYEMNKVFLFAGRSDILATSWLFWKCCRGICFWRKLRNVEWKFDWKTKLLQLFQICAGQHQSKVSRIVCPNNTCCWFLFVLLLQRTTTATTKHHKRNRADKNRCFLYSASFLIPWMNNFFDFVLDSPSLTLCSRLGAFFSNETVQYPWTNFGFTVNKTKLIIRL